MKVLDKILQNPVLIRYNHNALMEKLKNLSWNDSVPLITQKLRKSDELRAFLTEKLGSGRLGTLRKIDYLAFYEDIYGKDEQIRSVIVDKAMKHFQKIPSSTNDEIDYKETLFSSLLKHGHLDNDKRINLLKGIMEDKSEGAFSLRRRATEAASDMGEKGLPIIEMAIKDQHKRVRRAAAQEAGYFGEKGLPIIEQAIKDDDLYVRRNATEAARKLGEKAFHIIEQAIKDPHAEVRSSAAYSANYFGEKGLPIIKMAIKDQHEDVRAGAVASASYFGEEGLPIIEQAIKDDDLYVRRNATKAAGKLGEKAFPIIEIAIKDQHEDVRREAAQVVKQLDEKGLPIIEQAIKNQDEEVWTAAIYAAQKIGEGSLPLLKKNLNSSSNEQKKTTIQRLIDRIESKRKIRQGKNRQNIIRKARQREVRNCADKNQSY